MEYSEFSYSRSVRHVPLLVKDPVILDIDSTPREIGWSYRFSDAAIVTSIPRECTLTVDGVVFTPDNILSLVLLVVIGHHQDMTGTESSTTFTFSRMITSFSIIYHRFQISSTTELSLLEGDSISFYLQEGSDELSFNPVPPHDAVSVHPKFEICISTNPGLSKSTQ